MRLGNRSAFLKHNLIMFGATSLSSVLSFLYQVYLVRNLYPYEFGLFNSLLAIISIISIPLGALQALSAHLVSSFVALGQIFKIKYYILKIIKMVFWISLFFLTVFFALSSKINIFLKADSLLLIFILGITLVFYFFLPITQGGLQGLQKFSFLGLNVTVHSFSRLIIGIILFNLGLRLEGALSAFGISTLLAIILSYIGLENSCTSVRNESLRDCYSEGIELFNPLKYFLPTAIGLLCFMVLTNVDMILVKHFFKPQEA
ncbi:MAG: hypothetical protein NC900_04000, partial [Candidatus Omnitrophica bacterium]|nr:hypothetical protein [Candidatus Omnitrophota bacterium]